MPGLREILGAFHGRLRLGVVTSSPRKFTDVLLPGLGVDRYFDVIQTGDEIERGKPDPQIYLEAAAKLQVEPKACIVLEDSNSGALAAHRAGAFLIAVPSALTLDEDFSFADARVSNLIEAQSMIERRLLEAQPS
jgi:HAD superfamily hydrolase (TIGR01509 family)